MNGIALTAAVMLVSVPADAYDFTGNVVRIFDGQNDLISLTRSNQRRKSCPR